MAIEPPSDDPRNIWQNQPPEQPEMTPVMSLEEIHREKAKKLRANSRLQAALMPVVLILFAVLVAMVGHNPISQIAGALAILWTLVVHLPTVRRAWSYTTAGDAAMLSGLEFYRRELQYRLVQFRRVWITFLIPVVLALAGLAVPLMLAPAKAAPFFIILAIWFAMVFPMTRRQVQQIKLELAELDALERWQRDER